MFDRYVDGIPSSDEPDKSDDESLDVDELLAAGEEAADETVDEDADQDLFRIGDAIDISKLIDIPDFSEIVRSALPDFSQYQIDVGHLLPDFRDMLPDVRQMIPAINLPDLSHLIVPAIKIKDLLPNIDYSQYIPKINPTLSEDILKSLPDVSSMMPKISDFGSIFADLLASMRESLPPNWTDEVDLDDAIAVIQDDGIPLVWVPRSAIVIEVMAATDREARIRVLIDKQSEILEDCVSALAGVSHESLVGQVQLAGRAVASLASGNHEAAQALAVVVTETAVARSISGRYEEVKRVVLFDPELVPYTQVRLRAALAPVGRFYTQWYASSGTPAPEALSRHVTVHQADPTHYTPGNAIVAVMLVSSVLRALQELQELAESSDSE